MGIPSLIVLSTAPRSRNHPCLLYPFPIPRALVQIARMGEMETISLASMPTLRTQNVIVNSNYADGQITRPPHRGSQHQYRTERATLPHDPRPLRGADRQSPASVRRLENDSQASCSCRHQDRDRLSHLSRHKHHGLFGERRKARNSPTDGCPRISADARPP
jgi:hypothetical protein